MTFGLVLLFPVLLFQASLAEDARCVKDYAKLENYVQELIDEKTMSRDQEMEALKERVNNAESKIKVCKFG